MSSSTAALASTQAESSHHATRTDESAPLLQRPQRPRKKHFYRPRPLWLVPFAIVASLVRGMTLAPRLEVFTQLSCNRLHGDHRWNHTQSAPPPPFHDLSVSLYSIIDPVGPHIIPEAFALDPRAHARQPRGVASPQRRSSLGVLPPVSQSGQDEKDSEDTEDPRRIPSSRCLADPAVQAGAARLQTIMTTTMGLLSALTTGWWGHFGERHGRTKVLAIATFGLFLTDLTFILVSTPGSVLAEHGHNLLIVAPFIEGLLGGWSTLQSASSAYLSDCTSPGSRAGVFSRFQGVFYLGLAVGPGIGGWLIQHPFGVGNMPKGEKVVTTVFWVAIACSFMNFLLALFVFPESLDKKKQQEAAAAQLKGDTPPASPTSPHPFNGTGPEEFQGSRSAILERVEEEEPAPTTAVRNGERKRQGVIASFLSPLAIFLPVVVLDPSPNGLSVRKRRNWSLTILAIALFGFMLSTVSLDACSVFRRGGCQRSGLYQIKYYYATHTYGWDSQELSYYISFMGGGRALWLLFLLPSLISFLKPRYIGVQSNTAQGPNPKKKGKPTRAQLGREIGFDLMLARFSLLIDIIAHTLVAILPAPSYQTDLIRSLSTGGLSSFQRSEVLFVLATSLNGLGSGSVPAIHSIAVCILQVRERPLDGVEQQPGKEQTGTGPLFGALAVLQSIGQMILGPMLFGLVYSGTVATFPKAVFVLGSGIMVASLAMMFFVRNPVRMHPLQRRRQRRQLDDDNSQRGRSRQSKDLRGGAIMYNGYVSYGSTSPGSDNTSSSA
ncbi:hypothetical protein D9619_004865 [Psilocybe cf. subviscida]|uniref:MFS general substrate transporter n=1 Tax=Psilocybe cf. subviscida TaxID=2480587 RepID=A0A8H5BQG9_9AGAR|nr:hypothetical protein D9619_004865 [Psilocybe cf. subviscida]